MDWFVLQMIPIAQPNVNHVLIMIIKKQTKITVLSNQFVTNMKTKPTKKKPYFCGYKQQTTENKITTTIYYQCARKDSNERDNPWKLEDDYEDRIDCVPERRCIWENCDQCVNCDGGTSEECYIYGLGKCGHDKYTNKGEPNEILEVQDCKEPFQQDVGISYCPRSDGEIGTGIVLITDEMTRKNGSDYCFNRYGTAMASLLTPLDFYKVRLMLNYSGITKANIGLQSTHRGGWWEFDDGSCCDQEFNVYGTCIDGYRWEEGVPLKNCEHHIGTLSASVNHDGLVNNDIYGDELMPFFCNCPERKLNLCENNDEAKMVDINNLDHSYDTKT
eukprot:66151_1